MTAMTAAMLAILALSATTHVSAAETFEGRWAAEAGSCDGEAGRLLVVGARMLRWRETACMIRTSYLVGKAWHIGARCWAEGASADVPIKLQLRDDRLFLGWASVPQRELQRCP
jgi:hypothetical protein